MYPGLSDTNCQVAKLYYRQLVNEGLRQQRIAGAGPAPVVTRSVFASVRQRVGALLVCAGQRLHVQGGPAATSQGLTPTAASEMGAIA
jgi:hypothetical protein